MRVLIVEDERPLADAVARGLRREGMAVDVAYDGDTGHEKSSVTRYDVVILDRDLPGMSGDRLCTEIVKSGATTRVLLLTASGTLADKVEGLSRGADDYLAKPFDYDELLARVKALLRRASIRADETMMRVGDLSIDPISRDVTRAGRKLALTQKEYALLEYLMRHAGIPVTREQISEQVWKQPFDPTTNIVDVYINYLRKKLETDGGSPLVHTVRGVGYVLRESGTGEA
jgi:DNA-binding response OmpR family regulator